MFDFHQIIMWSFNVEEEIMYTRVASLSFKARATNIKYLTNNLQNYLP